MWCCKECVVVMENSRGMVLQRRQALRRKGYVWHKAKSLSRLSEGTKTFSVSADNLSSWKQKRSSLELAPALLSIYDSIAARTNGEVRCTLNNGNNKNDKVEDNEDSVDNLCKMASTSSIASIDQDCKKRPLSISSMSSASTSSLPRHVHKRPNLSPSDEIRSEDCCDKPPHGNFGEKLDRMLYIDDDVPSLGTDEEMPVDTDLVNKSNNEALDINSNTREVVSPHSCLHTPSRSAQSTTPSQDETPVQGQDSPGSHETPLQRRDSTSPQKYVSYVQRVVTEIIDTERTYINNLKEILEGYLGFIQNSDLKISSEDTTALFGNIKEIFDFGRAFLQELEKCGDDPVQVAECFVKNMDSFKIYAVYCTNYPRAVEILTMIMKDPELSELFKRQQLSLNHNLPLGAFLLKPVQRILKYHLLLQNILKHYKDEPGHETVQQAVNHMTSMAHHINEMKRKHEHAIRVQEIQSQLEDYEGEDLTRLGELVLEGSFRIYGAKTSRQVFLFEKGVLIGKRKEDGMLSCRVLIKCSNLMLVESIPKEPLSFQVIPFDNPKGQHTLQARNLEQKRKWCQEIKRLIIESFKGKIPEKVKGLVMQLGKSREEEAAKLTSSEPRKIYHHTAPEYLEKRQRMRRKSGTILTDLLKPQRAKKSQHRAESVSPRSSPPRERKGLSLSPSTPNTMSLYDDNTPQGPVDTPSYTDNNPVITSIKAVGRNISFRQAVKRQPLRSVDFGSVEDKENTSQQNNETPTSSRRSKSFKHATKLNPVLSKSNSELDSEEPTKSFHSPTKVSIKPEFDFSTSPLPSEQSISPKIMNKFNRIESNKGSMSRHTKYSSMPVLNVLEPPSPIINRSRKCSEDISSSQQVSSVAKRIFDTKLYFQRSRSEKDSDGRNFRRGNNSVSAFNDSFIRKSTDNLAPKVGPITLTKPRPFTSTLTTSRHKQEVKKSLSTGADSTDIDNEDPWEPKPNLPVYKNRNRTHSVGTENDIDEMDWIVYANRNSLPVNGFDLGPKLYKYCTPPRSSMEQAHKQIKSSKGENMLNDLIKNISTVSHPPTEISKSDNFLDDNHKTEEQHDFPNFGALPVVKVSRSQPKLNRSNSNPTSRLDKKMPRHSSPSLFDHHVIKDHEQIIAEMEDYLKRSESVSTVSSLKFPSDTGREDRKKENEVFLSDQNKSSDHNKDSENKRDSCLSNFSNSSYESSDTAPSSPGTENFMGTLKHKIHDLKQKLSHRRSGSYDNRDSSDNELDNDKSKSRETRSSLLSLFSNRPKEHVNTDLQTVLHAGEWGSPSIGQRMAEPEPTYIDISLTLKQPKSDQYKVNVNGQRKSLSENLNSNSLPMENLHLQNCDSAFSIQSDMAYGSVIDDSPRSQNEDDKSLGKGSQSGDSYYEQQFSVALDEAEPFRDSAVYCDVDPEQTQKSENKLPNRVPIKSYVQKLEEKILPIQPCVTKVKQREPGAIIKQRLEKLHSSSYKGGYCPSSVERELRFYSRPSSVERELRSPSRLSNEERQVRSLSLDKELPPHTDKPYLRRELLDTSYRQPTINRCSNDISSKRIEQLTTDLNNLIVMRGWVRQLIDKFQSKQ